jgi:hypothetical protein
MNCVQMKSNGSMTEDPTQVALAAWAAKDLPARLLAGQVAKLLNCSTEDVAILVSAGKLRALGKPKPNAVKFFNSIEWITLLADPDWLDDATKTIGQYWRRKNARRNGVTLEKLADAASVDSLAPSQKPSTKVPVNCLDSYPSFDMSYYKGKLFKSSKLSIKPLTACGPPQRCGQILENEFCSLGTLRWWWSGPRTRDGGLPPRCCSDHLFMGFLRNLLFTCCRRTTQRLLTTARESS